MLILFLGILITISILYIGVAFLVKWPPFTPKEGDICNPKTEDKVEHGLQYTINDDGDCTIDTCNIGYVPYGNNCDWDLTSDFLNVIGSWTISSDQVPKGFNNDDMDEMVLPFEESDMRQGITLEDGKAKFTDKNKLLNFCRRVCFKDEECKGVLLYDENTCIMLNDTFSSTGDLEQKTDSDRKTKLNIKKLQG